MVLTLQNHASHTCAGFQILKKNIYIYILIILLVICFNNMTIDYRYISNKVYYF